MPRFIQRMLCDLHARLKTHSTSTRGISCCARLHLAELTSPFSTLKVTIRKERKNGNYISAGSLQQYTSSVHRPLHIIFLKVLTLFIQEAVDQGFFHLLRVIAFEDKKHKCVCYVLLRRASFTQA